MNHEWRKSTYSTAEGNCVEVARNPTGAVAVRDSKNPDGVHLTLSRGEWRAFIGEIKTGRLG